MLFSISVVEHMTSSGDVEAFFADSRRILKDGACSIHLIDLLTSDEPSPLQIERYRKYGDSFFKFFLPMTSEMYDDLRFRSCYCTNPDNVMHMWKKDTPASGDAFAEQQMTTLILAGFAK